MQFKLGVFLAFLLLIQILEAKKKKPSPPTTPTPSITIYLKDISDFLHDAWEALLDLLPDVYVSKPPQKRPPKKQPHKEQPHKKTKNEDWGVNYYVKSATKNFNRIYKSLSTSLNMFQFGESKGGSRRDDGVEDAFFVELFAAEILEKVTWGLAGIVSNLDRKS